MPTYQYVCTDCAHRLETVQSFSDAALRDCPECTGSLRKVFSAVGVMFKGSGFYRNDSRVSAGKGAEGTEGGQPKKGEAAAAATTDSGSKETGGKMAKTESGKSTPSTTPKAATAGAS